MNIEQLKARLTELHEISKGIQAKADAEKRELEELRQARRDVEEAKRSRMGSAGVTE